MYSQLVVLERPDQQMTFGFQCDVTSRWQYNQSGKPGALPAVSLGGTQHLTNTVSQTT